MAYMFQNFDIKLTLFLLNTKYSASNFEIVFLLCFYVRLEVVDGFDPISYTVLGYRCQAALQEIKFVLSDLDLSLNLFTFLIYANRWWYRPLYIGLLCSLAKCYSVASTQ